MRWLNARSKTLAWSLGAAALVGVGLLGARRMRALRTASTDTVERHNDACAGNVRWPRSSQAQLGLRLRFSVDKESGLDPLRIRACRRGSCCETPLAQTTTQAGGFAALAIEPSALGNETAASTAGFDGFLLVDGGSRHQAQRILHSAPLQHGQCVVFRLSSDAVTRAVETSLSAPVLETQSVVHAQVDDANGQPASAIRLEVWNVAGSDYQLCTDCRVVYPNRGGAPDPAATEFSPGAGAPAWLVLTPREALFIARNSRTQQVVSALGPITLLPEAVHMLLAPASEARLAVLPQNIRGLPVH